jgi:hypothetical protein
MNIIDDSNFVLYAAKHYENPACIDEAEFYEDLGRIRNLQRLMSRYVKTGELKDRYILNHLIALYNVFERDAMTKMLVFKMRDQLQYLKPFLVLMGYWPERIEGIGKKNETIMGSDITMDPLIVMVLRRI